MKQRKNIGFLIFIVFNSLVTLLHAAYIEGLDTTSVDGYGLDSTFRILNGAISGQVIAHYNFDKHWCSGYYNYSFEDICLAPDTVLNGYGTEGQPFYCFIVKHQKDSTYSKVQVLKRLNGNQYTYRYLTNTIPNDRTLKDYYKKCTRNPGFFHKP
jgi:hypothetical protein